LTGRGTFRLTPAAREDVADILAQTEARFGIRQHDTYAASLASAMELVAREPARVGSQDRSDLHDGLRSFAVALAARRRKAATHVLYYRKANPASDGVEILRVLHQSMDAQARLGAASSD
jgi:toxin ParE1/3/4